MDDPQRDLKVWLGQCLDELGTSAAKRLAEHLGVKRSAITRMRNLDPAKESRRIEAQFIPLMAQFFRKAPPGFDGGGLAVSTEPPMATRIDRHELGRALRLVEIAIIEDNLAPTFSEKIEMIAILYENLIWDDTLPARHRRDAVRDTLHELRGGRGGDG